MLAFPITDTHVHFWNPNELRYPWLAGNAKLNRPFLPADYTAACGAVAVERIVFVECGGPGDQAEAEANWVSELAQTDPWIQAIVAHAPLEQGQEVAPILERLAAKPWVRGIRRLLQGESEPGYALRPEFIAGVQLLPRYNLSFDICIRHHQLPDVIELVRRCPEVRFVLDHIGKPHIKAGMREPWQTNIQTLAGLPNVHCKVSGLVTEADRISWTDDDLRPYVEAVIGAFGWERVFYGSDWPVSTQAAEYPRWVAALDTLTAGCSEAEKRALFAENGARFYRVDD
ncbi:MAG: amidohydrolase [Armatimonadaceae bacterium]